MASKTVTDADAFTVVVSADGTQNRTVAVRLLVSTGEQETYDIAVDASLTGTTAQQRQAFRDVVVALRARARVLGGWT